MTARAEVGTHPDQEQERSMALRDLRGTLAGIQDRDTSWMLENISDEDFEKLLAADKRREERTKQIILNRMTKGIHYGKVDGIEKPFAWEAAADCLAKFYRWHAYPMGEVKFAFVEGALIATVTVQVYDTFRRPVGVAATRCCSSLEKRFKKRGSGYKYDSPMEVANEVASMATKRAKVAGVLAAADAKPYFATPELLEPADGTPEPWTAEERKEFYKKARAKGYTKRTQVESFVMAVLGRTDVFTGDDVKLLMDALDRPVAEIKIPVDPYKPGDPATAASSFEQKPAALDDESDDLPF